MHMLKIRAIAVSSGYSIHDGPSRWDVYMFVFLDGHQNRFWRISLPLDGHLGRF